VKILVLEPYYGGSHRTFLDGMQAHLPYDFFLLTLPARHWKWRMRLAAPYFADRIRALPEDIEFDAIFCSSFVDVATLRSLLPAAIGRLPFYTYFHENQFAYPVRQEDERDFHFGLTNLTTVLASDRVAFSTGYNLETFLQGVEQIQRLRPDMKLRAMVEKIGARACILNPGMDFSRIDGAAGRKRERAGPPVIVWNHRWEHDKDPRRFFDTLFSLDADGLDFRLIVLGQSFRTVPAVFAEAQARLKSRIIHYGFAESPARYAELLHNGDIVASTAKHEFYGIAVIEAVRAGCYPLLPAGLAYPELFGPEYLYGEGEFPSRLKSLLQKRTTLDNSQARAMTERFSWAALKAGYMEWFGPSPGIPDP